MAPVGVLTQRLRKKHCCLACSWGAVPGSHKASIRRTALVPEWPGGWPSGVAPPLTQIYDLPFHSAQSGLFSALASWLAPPILWDSAQVSGSQKLPRCPDSLLRSGWSVSE